MHRLFLGYYYKDEKKIHLWLESAVSPKTQLYEWVNVEGHQWFLDADSSTFANVTQNVPYSFSGIGNYPNHTPKTDGCVAVILNEDNTVKAWGVPPRDTLRGVINPIHFVG